MEEPVELAIVEKTAFNVITYLRVIPSSGEKPPGKPSNSEIMRWLNNGSVIINGKKPKANELVQFPITELIFFPKSKTRKTTVI